MAEAVLVKRVIALAAPVDEAALVPLRVAPGVASVRALAGGRRIEVAYDVTKTDLAGVEAVCTAGGVGLDERPLARLARAFAAFRDGNQRAQAKVVYNCCSAPSLPPTKPR